MDIDQIKAQWKLMDSTKGLADKVDRDFLFRKRYKSMLSLTDKLRRRYLCSLILCSVAPLLIKPLAGFIELPTALMIAYPAYFVVMFALNLLLYLKLNKTSVINLPVKDALVGITEFAIMRRRFECVGILIAIPLIVYIIWILRAADNEGLYIGGLFGAVLGVIIGLIVEYRTTRDVHRLKEGLCKNLDDDAA